MENKESVVEMFFPYKNLRQYAIQAEGQAYTMDLFGDPVALGTKKSGYVMSYPSGVTSDITKAMLFTDDENGKANLKREYDFAKKDFANVRIVELQPVIVKDVGALFD